MVSVAALCFSAQPNFTAIWICRTHTSLPVQIIHLMPVSLPQPTPLPYYLWITKNMPIENDMAGLCWRGCECGVRCAPRIHVSAGSAGENFSVDARFYARKSVKIYIKFKSDRKVYNSQKSNVMFSICSRFGFVKGHRGRLWLLAIHSISSYML